MKEFFRRWKKGIQEAMLSMTPEQLLQGQVVFQAGAIAGMVAGFVYALIKHLHWLAVILFCAAFVSFFQLVGMYQQLHALKSLKSKLINISQIQTSQSTSQSQDQPSLSYVK